MLQNCVLFIADKVQLQKVNIWKIDFFFFFFDCVSKLIILLCCLQNLYDLQQERKTYKKKLLSKMK